MTRAIARGCCAVSSCQGAPEATGTNRRRNGKPASHDNLTTPETTATGNHAVEIFALGQSLDVEEEVLPMRRTIEESVREFISNEGERSDAVNTFLDRLRNKDYEYAKTGRRYMLWALFFALAFELLSRGLVDEITILSIKLAKLSFLPLLIPPIIAYIILYSALLGKVRGILGTAYDAALMHATPHYYNSRLESLLPQLSMPFIVRATGSDQFVEQAVRPKVQIVIELIEAFIFTLTPFLFGIHAYLQLFHLRSASDLLTWISLAVTLIVAFTTFGVLASTERWRSKQEIRQIVES